MLWSLTITLHASPNKHLKLFVFIWETVVDCCCCCCGQCDQWQWRRHCSGPELSHQLRQSSPCEHTDHSLQTTQDNDHCHQRWKWSHLTKENCQSVRGITLQKRPAPGTEMELRQVRRDEIFLLKNTLKLFFLSDGRSWVVCIWVTRPTVTVLSFPEREDKKQNRPND